MRAAPLGLRSCVAFVLAVAALPGGTSRAQAPQLPSYTRVITPPTLGVLQWIVAVLDFTGDGRQDLLVGGSRDAGNYCDPNARPLAPPLRVMASNGDGTFRDATTEVVTRSPSTFFNPARPVAGVVGDFNNDGRPDIAVFDYGTECGRLPAGHTFYGYPPVLLLSTPDGKWAASTALADAIARYHATSLTVYSGPNLRALGGSAGDMDGDGRVDLWVESTGGENVLNHLLMNNADGTFTVDVNRVEFAALHNFSPDFWRQQASALVDLNGDGHLDLLLGQGKTSDITHITESSLVIFNDGTGRFRLVNRLLLPAPTHAGGITAVQALAVADLDDDGWKDVILTHRPNEIGGDYSGRSIQILMNRGGTRFVDETTTRMGDQSAAMAQTSAVYGGPLSNQPWALLVTDANNDAVPDLVVNSYFPIGMDNPLVHLNDGTGHFTVMDPNVFTGGELYFGENSMPLDLNGDGVLDFTHTDSVPGADGVYGTGDDATRLIALVGKGIPRGAPAPPGQLRSSTSGSTLTLSWHAPAIGPVPNGYVIEAGSAPGLANLASFTRGPATTFVVPSGVPAGTFYFRVRSITAFGMSAPSPDTTAIVGAGCVSSPIPPVGLWSQAANSITVSWSASPGATSFVLEAGSASGANNLAVVPTANTIYTAPAVPPGRYYVRVRARNACGTSAPSPEIVVDAMPCTAPSAPMAVSSVSGSRVTVNFTSSLGVTGHRIEAGSAPGLSNLMVTTLPLSGPLVVNSVPRGTYFVRVRSQSACGVSAPSNELTIMVN